MKKWPIFGRKWPISDRFLAWGGSNGISNDVFSISVIKNCIYNKGKLISAKITAQNSEIRGNFAWITFFSLWTVKLLFVIFGRLSYTFLKDKICNLSVQPVYCPFLTSWLIDYESRILTQTAAKICILSFMYFSQQKAAWKLISIKENPLRHHLNGNQSPKLTKSEALDLILRWFLS